MINLWNDEEKQPKRFVRFGYNKQSGRHIVAHICNENGDRVENGHLLYIASSGEFVRCRRVDPDAAAAAGVLLDDEGRWRMAE